MCLLAAFSGWTSTLEQKSQGEILEKHGPNTLKEHNGQNMKLSIKDFFSKCDQIRLKKSLMKNFIFCAVTFEILRRKSPHTLL